MKYKKNILYRITLQFFLFIVIPISLLFVYNFRQLQSSLKNEAKYQADLFGQQIINEISSHVDMAENICNAIAYDQKLIDFLESSGVFNSERITTYKDIIYSFISQSLSYNKAGVSKYFFFMANENIPEGWGDFWSFWRIRDKQWFGNFSQADQIDMWFDGTVRNLYDYKYDTQEPKKFRFYARKINNIEGETLAVLVLAFDENEFYLSSIDKKTETKAVILNDRDGNGIVQFIPDKQKKYPYVTVKNYREQGINIVIMQTLEEQAAIYRYNKINLLGILIAFLLFIALFYHSIRVVFIKINKSVKIVEQAITKEKDVRVPVESKDELGRLAESFNSLIEKNNALIKDIVRQEVMQKNTQIKALQYQINPHFFYNTLDIISSKMILGGNLETADVISGFGKMLRYNISSKSMYTTLASELMYIKQYTAIQKLRYGNRLKLHIDTNDQVNYVEMIKFILQPIVENSILHGMDEGRKQELEIAVKCYLDEDSHLVITVTDNGKGLAETELEEINRILKQADYETYKVDATHKERGIGLENINERLKIFYGEQFGLLMELNSGGGLKTTIRIPISKK